MTRRLGVGPSRPALILVGEAFGEVEEAMGIPFTGPAGNLLNGILANLRKEFGFPGRNDLYVTNLLNERPSEGSNDISPYYHKGQLTERGLAAQRELLEELASIDCKVIVALGETATHALTNRALSITRWRGSPLAGPPGRLVIPSLHPSYIQRGNFEESFLLACDLRKALSYTQRSPQTYATKTLYDSAEATALITTARRMPAVAFDIEAPNGELACFSLCFNDQSAYSIVLTRTNRNAVLTALRSLLQPIEGPLIITQNGNYDTTFLEESLGIRTNLVRLEDTMYLHHCMYPEIPKKLSVLSSIYTDVPYYKDDYATARDTANPELLYAYNAKDALVTYLIWMRLQTLPQFARFEHTYRALTMANLPAAQYMQRMGFRVDHRAWANLRQEAEAEIAPRQAQLNEATSSWREGRKKTLTDALGAAAKTLAAVDAGLQSLRDAAPKGSKGQFRTSPERKAAAEDVNALCKKLEWFEGDFNVASNPMVGAFFAEAYGVRGGRSKSTGEPTSFNEKALQGLARETATRAALPEAKLILDIREHRKQVEGFLNARLDAAGRFRFSINIRGTKYGRFSSSELLWRYGGNVMNLPRSFRQVFIADAPDEDCIPFLVNLDQSKAEYVHVANLAQEPAMLKAIEERLDVHAWTAELISHIPMNVILEEAHALGETTSVAEIGAWRARNPLWLSLSEESRRMAQSLSPDASLRQFGKKRNHAKNYRESFMGYSYRTGTSIADAKRLDALQDKAFPMIPVWQDQIKWTVLRDRQLVNCFGRIIPFIGPFDERMWNSACSALPQSGVADATADAMRFIHATNLASVRNNVYDALLLQMYIRKGVPLVDEAQRLVRAIQDCVLAMSKPLSYEGRSFQVGIDAKVGLCWGKLAALPSITPETLLPHLQTIVEAAR